MGDGIVDANAVFAALWLLSAAFFRAASKRDHWAAAAH